ncbi:MAG: hypothetical protein AAFU77_10820 [Myxococcota bacterium]
MADPISSSTRSFHVPHGASHAPALDDIFRSLASSLGDLYNASRSTAIARAAINGLLQQRPDLGGDGSPEALTAAYQAYAGRAVRAAREEIAARALLQTAGGEPVGAMTSETSNVVVSRLLDASLLRGSSIRNAHRIASEGVLTGPEYRSFVDALRTAELKDGSALDALVEVVNGSFQSVDPALFSDGMRLYGADENALRRVLFDRDRVDPTVALDPSQRNAIRELRARKRFSEAMLGPLLDGLEAGISPRELGLAP